MTTDKDIIKKNLIDAQTEAIKVETEIIDKETKETDEFIEEVVEPIEEVKPVEETVKEPVKEQHLNPMARDGRGRFLYSVDELEEVLPKSEGYSKQNKKRPIK